MNYTTIKNAVLSRIGWRQNPDPTGTQLLSLYSSSTGLYYNDVHPLLTFDNILALCYDDSDITYPTYNAGTTYSFGNIVSEGGEKFIYINQTAASGNATNNTTYWRSYNVITESLRTETESGIVRTINQWFNSKKIFRTAENLLENDTLIVATGNTVDINTNEGKVRFIEITPKYSESLVFEPYKIGLHFQTAQTIPIKVFQSGISTPIYSESFNYTTAGSIQWFDIDLQLESGSKYWISYDESEITNGSYNSVKDYGHDISVTRQLQYNSFPTGKYYNAIAGSHSEGNTSLWDITKNSYHLDNNFGINLKSRVVCDYTDFIVSQIDLFDEAIMLNVGISVLRKFVFNPNAVVDRYEANLDTKTILYEIDGDSQGNSRVNNRLSAQYKAAIEAIQFDTRGIDKICLPCKRRGIKKGSVI